MENSFAPNLTNDHIDTMIEIHIMSEQLDNRVTDPFSSTETYAFKVVTAMAKKGYTFAISVRPTDEGQRPTFSVAFWKNGYNESGTVRDLSAPRAICLAAMSAENLLQAHEYGDSALEHIKFNLPTQRYTAVSLAR